MQLLSAKNLAIFFGLATIAFTISTIVLAVQKSNLQDELNDALDKIGLTGSTTPTTSTAATVPSGQTTSTTKGGETIPIVTTTTISSTTPNTTAEPTTTAEPITTLNPNFPNPNEILYRLPNHVRPWKYKIYLHPDLIQGSFEGSVSIALIIDEPTNVIALHSQNLNILGISFLEVMSKMRIRVKDYYTDPVRQLLIIEFYEVLHLYAPYTLSISFHGSLRGLTGFYSSSYTDDQGGQK